MTKTCLIFVLPALALLGCTTESSVTGETESGEDGTGADTSTDETETDTETTGDGDGDESCPTPLPPEAFDPDNHLAFGVWVGAIELPVASDFQFRVGLIEQETSWMPLDACAEFSVEPADVGASIDPQTGLLSLAADMPDATALTVRADIEQGTASIEQAVLVYRPEDHPLEGYWHEVARIPCDAGPEFAPSDPIGELHFAAGGAVQVTWTPFEIYVDYWGDYAADYDAGTLLLSDLVGNYVPEDVDPEGSFAFDGPQLVLTDMWLGSSLDSVAPPACGHRFAK